MNEKFCILIQIPLKLVTTGPIDNKSGNGFAPNRLQPVTWTKADVVHQRIYMAFGGDELSDFGHPMVLQILISIGSG